MFGLKIPLISIDEQKTTDESALVIKTFDIGASQFTFLEINCF
jgi:hypothetical protein